MDSVGEHPQIGVRVIYYLAKSRIYHIPRVDEDGALCNPRLKHYEEVEADPRVVQNNICMECIRRTKFYKRTRKHAATEEKDS